MGECPDWYAVLLSADRLHCPPWELLGRSEYWRSIAVMARRAEAENHKKPGTRTG